MNNDDLNSLIEISQENESAFPEAVRKKYDLAVGDIIEWIPQDSGAFTIKKSLFR